MKSSILYLGIENDPLPEILKEEFSSENINIDIFHDYSNFSEALPNQPGIAIIDVMHDNSWIALKDIKSTQTQSQTRTIAILPENHHSYKVSDFCILADRMLVQPVSVDEIKEIVSELENMMTLLDNLHLHEIATRFPSTEEAMVKAWDFINYVLGQTNLKYEKQVQFAAVIQEAVNNAVAHGNKYRRDKCVDLTLIVEYSRVSVIIADEGRGFNWREAINYAKNTTPQEIVKKHQTEGKLGGIGFVMMTKYCDMIEYNENGTVVILSKYFEEKKS